MKGISCGGFFGAQATAKTASKSAVETQCEAEFFIEISLTLCYLAQTTGVVVDFRDNRLHDFNVGVLEVRLAALRANPCRDAIEGNVDAFAIHMQWR